MVHLFQPLLPLFACAATGLAAPALAGGTPEHALVIIDPSSAVSMRVGNHYAFARQIPPENVLYMSPAGAGFTSTAGAQVPAFLGTIANREIEDHVDFVVLTPGGDYRMTAAGLVTDNCFTVGHFALPTPYTMARNLDEILAGGMTSQAGNGYKTAGWSVQAFDSSVTWYMGDESTNAAARRYFIGALLGYDGNRGNTPDEIIDMIDRSVAADGSLPAGTFYFMETTDSARSSPRHGTFPATVAKILLWSGLAQHLLAVLPDGQHDCLGVMTGWASPDIDGANLTLLPGSFADHLTSYAGHFDTGSQAKMSRWIAKGASASVGAVEEPCNYGGKFPHSRTHFYYYRGLSLGEAWFRGAGFVPFQMLFLGDPLTRTFTHIPVVSVPDAPTGTVSGTIALTPSATTTYPGAGIAVFELMVDGIILDSVAPGSAFALDTTSLADGWHDVRVFATDDRPMEATGRWLGELVVDNGGRSMLLLPSAITGDLGTLFGFDLRAFGAPADEVRLLQNGRLVAAIAANQGTVSIWGNTLGADTSAVQAEAFYSDGSRARSAPVEITIATTGGGTQQPPVGFNHSVTVLDGQITVLGLPATHDDDPSSAIFTLVTSPAQANVTAFDGGAWCAIEPQPSATGVDTLTFQISTAGGTDTGTVTITYGSSDPCAQGTTYCPLTPNSVGPGSSIAMAGSTSVSANDLVLSASACPANQFGIFFYGPSAGQVPFGDGNRCVTGQMFRLPVIQADGAGQASYAIDVTAPPQPTGQITSGSTWFFQFWYRDPSGGGGSGFNLSDAIELNFCS
jgi:uncharacterized protein (TIGR03790 family)